MALWLCTVVLLAGLPLAVAQASSLWQRYQARPTAQAQLQEQVAAWVRRNSEPTATIVGFPTFELFGGTARWWEL